MKYLLLIASLAACTGSPDSALDTDLAERRGQMLAWLADYTERGEFPTDERGLPVSVFKDARGVRCPMAELMYRSGHADLVDAIAAEDNHARLADVHDGPVHDWMLGSGLTRDEIIMIQGIADLSQNFIIPEQHKPQLIVAQRERVRGRLELAQVALRKDAQDSLRHATAALPQDRVPVVRVARPVLAKRN
jgi:hypothetical protein